MLLGYRVFDQITCRRSKTDAVLDTGPALKRAVNQFVHDVPLTLYRPASRKWGRFP